MTLYRALLLILCAGLCVGLMCAPAAGQASSLTQIPPATAAGSSEHLVNVVSTTRGWTDTEIDLHSGQLVQFTAKDAKGNCHADGSKDGKNDTGKSEVAKSEADKDEGTKNERVKSEGLPLAADAHGALIARIGNGTPFLVGASRKLPVAETGRLYLGMNSGRVPACKGELAVELSVMSESAQAKTKLMTAMQTWLSGQFGTSGVQPAAVSATTSSATASPAGTSSTASSSAVSSGTATVASAAANTAGNAVASLIISKEKLAENFAKDLQGLPRRVNDEFKNQGDMVNFLIVGSKEQVQKALTTGGWKVADLTTQSAIANVVQSIYAKQDYLQMPMSTLYLFNRPQDFGYEQAEAYAVVASRHHFRIWKAPFTCDGQPVWVGAGTHDIGFEKDQRNGKVTHKIDPAVDGERDHIGMSLQSAGVVKTLSYYEPSNAIKEARNATGGSYHSDGRLLVIVLR